MEDDSGDRDGEASTDNMSAPDNSDTSTDTLDLAFTVLDANTAAPGNIQSSISVARYIARQQTRPFPIHTQSTLCFTNLGGLRPTRYRKVWPMHRKIMDGALSTSGSTRELHQALVSV